MKLGVSGLRGQEKLNKVLLTDSQALPPYNYWSVSYLQGGKGKGFHNTVVSNKCSSAKWIKTIYK